MGLILDIITILQSNNNILSDTDLSRLLNRNKTTIQVGISDCNRNKNKWKSFGIIRHGKTNNYSREFINLNSSPKDILGKQNRDLHLKKGITQFEISKKLGDLSLKTTQGIKNQNMIINQILKSNLNTIVAAQQAL